MSSLSRWLEFVSRVSPVVERGARSTGDILLSTIEQYLSGFRGQCLGHGVLHAFPSDQEPHVIERLVWDGHGCSISQASLSVMVDLVEGKTVDEAMELAGTFHKLMESRGKGLDDESAEESLEDGIVFQGVSKYPMRIKCALLGWEGMKDSVAKALAAKA